jgi:hypothetical protein
VRPDNPEVNQQLHDRLGGHPGAAVGMDNGGGDPDAGDGVGDERLGELGGLAGATSQPGA